MKINDLEFILRPFHEDGALISGQSKLHNISCHVRINDNDLKKLGVTYFNFVCKKIEKDLNDYLGLKNNQSMSDYSNNQT